jgi:hypothetical protein
MSGMISCHFFITLVLILLLFLEPQLGHLSFPDTQFQIPPKIDASVIAESPLLGAGILGVGTGIDVATVDSEGDGGNFLSDLITKVSLHFVH